MQLEVAVQAPEQVIAPSKEQKRRYRRHPKPDEDAPEKPASAYVLFSNQIRDEVRTQNLSFTEIARLVGERWQKLDPSEKRKFDARAAENKEEYNRLLAKYKKTESYEKYASYLADFRAKHGGHFDGAVASSNDSKKPKLHSDHHSASFEDSQSDDWSEYTPPEFSHRRISSVSSVNTVSRPYKHSSGIQTKYPASAHGNPSQSMRSPSSPLLQMYAEPLKSPTVHYALRKHHSDAYDSQDSSFLPSRELQASPLGSVSASVQSIDHFQTGGRYDSRLPSRPAELSENNASSYNYSVDPRLSPRVDHDSEPSSAHSDKQSDHGRFGFGPPQKRLPSLQQVGLNSIPIARLVEPVTLHESGHAQRKIPSFDTSGGAPPSNRQVPNDTSRTVSLGHRYQQGSIEAMSIRSDAGRDVANNNYRGNVSGTDVLTDKSGNRPLK